MAGIVELENLRSLQRDLLDFSELRLTNIDRLLSNLDAHIQAFRDLLDKPARSEASRRTLNAGMYFDAQCAHPLKYSGLRRPYTLGTIEFNDVNYQLNAEYQNEALQLSDGLDLDEVECARLLLGSGEEATELDRSRLVTAVIRFHDKRLCTLECLRLLLQQHLDVNVEEALRSVLHELILRILDFKAGAIEKETRYLQKCTLAMQNIEQWLIRLAEQAQRAATIGGASEELIEYQRHSLNQQHESLSAIYVQFVKSNYSLVEDFYKLLDHVPRIDRWNGPAMHYVPMVLCLISEFGSPEGRATLAEARALHRKLVEEKDSKPWLLPQFQAAAICWWIAEYTGWYYDRPLTSPLQGVDLAAEGLARDQAFDKALRDGALQFTLSLSTQVKSRDWQDPAQKRLTQLLNDMPMVPSEAFIAQGYLQDLTMEQLGFFVESFITNMPDTLRRFKTQEDDQRRKLLSGFLNGHQNSIPETDFNLERFLIIMSYAYEDRPDAAQTFWEDQNSNFYGFLQWASKRQATPRVGAFCEAFRAISQGPENSSAAHTFLLEDPSASSGRLRRSTALSWVQILQEIKLYAYSTQEPTSSAGRKPGISNTVKSVDIDEPESWIMLETYLRLAFHLCRESEVIRTWMLNHQDQISILDALFHLCNRGIPGSLRGCAFNLVEALLVGKSTALGNSVWTVLDQWVYGSMGAMAGGQRPPRTITYQGRAENIRFDTIASTYDECNAFLGLLTALVDPATESAELNDALPFPEQLGGANRMPGIDPYVDFVLGNVFTIQAPQQYDLLCLQTLSFRSLEFAAICLRTFNEDLLVLANESNMNVDESMNTSSLNAYARLHPFCRVMEWMFNDKVIAILFSVLHQDINEVMKSPLDSPLVLLLMAGLDVMGSIMDLQATYADIVRPLVQQELSSNRKMVCNPSLTLFEDAVANNLGIIIDLGRYCATHTPLAVSSLTLLTKFASSRKLNAVPRNLANSTANGNKLIGAFNHSQETEAVARTLIAGLDFDERELSQGPDSLGYKIKLATLEFLDKALIVSPERPSIAHALLGFTCNGAAVHVEQGSMFRSATSLFHKVLAFAVEYPDGTEGSLMSWNMRVKEKANNVLATLWCSAMTSELVLNELRDLDFLVQRFITQITLDNTTRWDGMLLEDPNNLLGEHGTSFEYYLRQRYFLLEYAAAAYRHTIRTGMSSARERVLAAILGSVTLQSGEQISYLSLLDLFDFMGLNDAYSLSRPQTKFLSSLDIKVALKNEPSSPAPRYELKLVAEQISLISNEVRKAKELKVEIDAAPLPREAQDTLCYFQAMNNRARIESAKLDTLRAWADLMALILNSGNLEIADSSVFTLRALQIMSSKLDVDALTTAAEALILARLTSTLLSNLSLDAEAFESRKASDMAYDRLFQLFRVCIRAIGNAHGNGSFREMLYSICTKFLAKTEGVVETNQRRNQRFQVVKSAGENFVETLCDDAYGGEGACGTAALLLLDAVTASIQEENPTFMLDIFSHINFVVIMVDSLKDIPDEILDDNGKGLPPTEATRYSSND